MPKFEKLNNYSALIEYVESNYNEEMKNFILIDEVQMCENFEKAK